MEIFKKLLGLLGFFSIFYLLFIYDQAKASCPSATAEVEDRRPSVIVPPTELEQMEYLAKVMEGVAISKDPPLILSPYSQAIIKDRHLHDIPRPEPSHPGLITIELPHHMPLLAPIEAGKLFKAYFTYYVKTFDINLKKLSPQQYDMFIAFIFEIANPI